MADDFREEQTLAGTVDRLDAGIGYGAGVF
jgi:hypothetical protein